eukprot:CAMPEP_0181207050 /NCGR_PEP_ID=MMETSP1096-20121128/21367_2 /TAXON_ID=156174 ORGANISM="Chrysochromulina ericina, Strain CCMP281" /NCGR_SAMPLE_ID=MMETSP1096 /ASSEMBLY_ACC=CAM_ASM_000453 /LENGTH=70 /DNA_ID=CAMNT_0023298001 /DNA_START=897 /DNA_END=1109 /DNA_ORIENTATION=-
MSGAKMTSAARFPKRSTPSPKRGVQRAEMIYGSDMTRPACLVAANAARQNSWKGTSLCLQPPGGCGEEAV